MISLLDDDIQLTDLPGGVQFDLVGDGTLETLAWTTQGSDDAFLALDRNENGRIDSGKELFGDFTAQPLQDDDTPNGFRALSLFDSRFNGGDENGWIDANDRIFTHLWLWTDADHDGQSSRDELRRLQESGIEAVSVRYSTSERVDEHGNEFRYSAPVLRSNNRETTAWDVFLLMIR